MMFAKILIANRGEIACRVIRTAKLMGIRTVAVYSDADVNALHVSLADEAIHIGGAASRESYLLGEKIIQAAIKTGAQAVHPGYGFLSENAAFCRACADNDIVFIGPPVAAIEAMGSKSAAKNIMGAAGVPLVPGYHGEDQDREILRQSALDMGFPVLLKAVAGGGGKGMRQVWKAEGFDEALDTAKREALNAFGDDVMLVEKYLAQPRHVEIQVFCDKQGNAVYLFERDCSVQRRHQKVIEEAPAPGMTQTLREQMGQAAVLAAKAIDYEGAGTVEFLLDSGGSFYFMEMNTRLQVEHPVTEMITGQDLVEWQLRIAAGEQLPLEQRELKINGHSFEARIYAEDPDNDFLPVTGRLDSLLQPNESNNVRIDTGVRQGDEISVFYDPMIAKLVVWDESRDKALKRLAQALCEYRIGGTTTNIDFLHALATSQPFIDADLNTGFIEKHYAMIFNKKEKNIDAVIPQAALYLKLSQADIGSCGKPNSPWALRDNWRLNLPSEQQFDVCFDDNYLVRVGVETLTFDSGLSYKVSWDDNSVNITGQLNGNQLSTTIDGHRLSVTAVNNQDGFSLYDEHTTTQFKIEQPDFGDDSDAGDTGSLRAPMNGVVSTLLVNTGDQVVKGDTLLIMEAMKMEHAIKAPANGVVTEFYFQQGDLVSGGIELLVFDEEQEP